MPIWVMGRCHHLSMWLNCHTGLVSGITGITKKWLVTCMFPISIPLCPVFLCSICLTLGQRRSLPYLYVPCIVPVFAALEGFLLLSQLIDTLAYHHSHSNSPIVSHHLIVLLSPLVQTLLSLLSMHFTGPHLEDVYK